MFSSPTAFARKKKTSKQVSKNNHRISTEADQVLTHTGLDQLVLGQLLVGRRSRVDDERLGIAHVGQMGPQGKRLDKLHAGRAPALDAKDDDRAKRVVAKVLLSELVRGVRLEPRVVDPGDARVLLQELCDVEGIGAVLTHADMQGLHAQEQQKAVEGRDAAAHVAHDLHTCLGDKGKRAKVVRVDHVVVRRIGRGEPGELAALGPVKVATVDDQPADGRAVAADPFCGRVDDLRCRGGKKTNIDKATFKINKK